MHFQTYLRLNGLKTLLNEILEKTPVWEEIVKLQTENKKGNYLLGSVTKKKTPTNHNNKPN